LATNPFTQGSFRVRAIKLYSEKEFIDISDFESSDGVNMPKIVGGVGSHSTKHSFNAEIETSTRLYRTEYAQSVILKLSERGCRMLTYVMQKLAKQSDTVEIKSEDFMGLFSVLSIQTFYNSLNDLMDAGVIARYKTNRYWINPSVIFNGNRITKYPDKVDIEADVKYSKKGND
jgi:hypothetical protein